MADNTENNEEAESTITLDDTELVERRALIDLIDALVDNKFLNVTDKSNEYETTGVVVPTAKIATKEEDDFLDEYKRFRWVVLAYTNLYIAYSGDFFSPASSYDNNFETAVIQKEQLKEIVVSPIFSSYRVKWEEIYNDLTQNSPKVYKREELEENIGIIIDARNHILNNFILLIERVMRSWVKDISINHLQSEQFQTKFGVELWPSSDDMPKGNILIRNLLIESDRNVEQSKLLVIQDPPPKVMENIIHLLPIQKGSNLYVLILKVDKVLTVNVSESYNVSEHHLTSNWITNRTIDSTKDAFGKFWHTNFLELLIPSKVYPFEKAIDAVISFVSVLQDLINCDLVLEMNPRDSLVLNKKGKSLHTLRDYNKAIKCYDEALEINEMFVEAWNNRGNSLRKLMAFEEAIKCYDKALEINEMFVEALNNKGKVLLDQKKDEEAIQFFDKSININDRFPNAWNNKGRVLYNKKKYEEAIKCYDKALEIKPEMPRWLNNKGNAYRGLGKFEEAAKLYEKALEIDPQYGPALKNRQSLVVTSDLEIGYSCWRYPKADDEYHRKMYAFQVIIKASDRILDRIESVTYRLPAWPNPTRMVTDRNTKFELKELAWGASTIYADVKIMGQENITTLSHPIVLTEKGPRLR